MTSPEYRDHDHDCDHDHDHDGDHDHDFTRADAGPGILDDGDRMAVYQDHGIAFLFPERWTIQEDLTDTHQTVTIQSPGTAFWQAILFPGESAAAVVESVLEAFTETYDDLDKYESQAMQSGYPALVCELDFACLDLLSSAVLIAFDTPAQAIVLLYQGEDRELEVRRPQLEAITRSLRVEALGTPSGFTED